MATDGNDSFLSISQLSLPIFNGECYEYWSIKMKTLFKSEDLWDLVEHGYDDDLEDEDKLKENRKRDSMALFFIQRGVHESIFWRIATATTLKEAWTILQTEFQVSSQVMASKLRTLRCEFETLHMKNSETVQSFVSRTEAIVNQMRRYGDNMAEQTVVTKILRSLTAMFDHVVTVIEVTKDLTTLTINELSGSLQAHEARISMSAGKNGEKAFQVKRETSFAKEGNKAASRGGRSGFRGRSGGRDRGRGSQQRHYSIDHQSHRGNIQDCWFC